MHIENFLKLHMRCSASQMFTDNNLLNFEALMRTMSNTCINRLISSENAIIKVLLDNMVAREIMWEYCYSILLLYINIFIRTYWL